MTVKDTLFWQRLRSRLKVPIRRDAGEDTCLFCRKRRALTMHKTFHRGLTIYVYCCWNCWEKGMKK